ncbi:MAG: hypothetical protein ABIC39_06330 [Pseudomonadota bacterium]
MKDTKEINYKELFEHVKNLKMVLLVATARSGSDFFQSLLDGHPEILQFTGVWFFHQWWQAAKHKDSLPDLIDEFVRPVPDSFNHLAKFQSYHDKIERWDQLGPNKNESFEVDIDLFKKHMINILQDKELSSINFFLAVNLAYGLATNVDIKKTKILFYHIHRPERIEAFAADFSGYDVICMVREPRNTLISGIEHWKKIRPGNYSSSFWHYLLRRIFQESEPLLQYTSDFRTLKLEDLHLFSREVFQEFCRRYGLEFQESMLESSFQGKKWWGDVLSGKYLDGFNNKIAVSKWNDKLFLHDNFLLEFILADRLKHYGYSLENKFSRTSVFLAILLTFLPMKYELKILRHNLSKGTTLRAKVRALYDGVIFYLLRVRLYLSCILKKIRKKTHLADFYLQNKYVSEASR